MPHRHMATRQRLIVCLDGTWNKQDSSTNILHHFNLVKEGVDPATGICQKKFYHPGVGTGPLDSITGGGFGFGLEQNVRDAYNWLVANYCEGDDDTPADEIYIFGFSRGAYTARSLVGFIGECGLLRRAAPITCEQLWSQYCILGRQKEERTSFWERHFGSPPARIRAMTQLISDPWSHRKFLADDMNPSELLLIRWSRRVRITYLGVYDTVGAIGLDALAIPGLTSRLAMHNNMRPTTLIQHCRHALAINENRSSFNHTPFLAFVGNDAGETDRGENGGSGREVGNASQDWARTQAMWRRKIEQRWFTGAHSNIGGGYNDNRLAQRPLHWLAEGATQIGLLVEPLPTDATVTPKDQIPRDSYAEFAAPLWTQIIRAKRNYRSIDPDPFPQARANQPKDGSVAAGFSLESIHEGIDESVISYWTNSTTPLPPNLQDYMQRRGMTIPGATPAAHTWMQDRAGYVVLVLWATLAVAGLFAVDRLTGLIPASARLWVACAIAFAAPLVDWSESKVTFLCALGWKHPRERAFLDAIYWTRTLGFVLVVFGAIYSVVTLLQMGWDEAWPTKAFAQEHWGYWGVPVCAAVGALLASRFRAKGAWVALVLGPLFAAGIALILFGVGALAAKLFPDVSSTHGLFDAGFDGPSMAGLLLLLQLAVVYLWRAWIWTGEPMHAANLGSIFPLQCCITPAKVAACLEHWRSMLECRWREEDRDKIKGPAAQRMRELVRQALWRDILGLIPVYTLVFLLGLWFAQADLGPDTLGWHFLSWPGGKLGLWWILPVLTAATDYLEDICQLRFCELHRLGRQPSSGLALFSWSMSWVKNTAFVVALLLTAGAVIEGTYQVQNQLSDWRAKIAVLVTLAGLAAVAALAAGFVVRAWHILRFERKA